MIEFVVSSGMNRVSEAPPSSRKLGPRPVPPGAPNVAVREADPAMLDWLGKPGEPNGPVEPEVPTPPGRVVVPVLVEEGLAPVPRPKMASRVAARSRALVFSAK